MTTVLAQRDGEWFLAAFAKHLNGCNLSTPREPVLQREKFHLWRGQLYVQSHASLQGITFYPELYYHGMKVWPQLWVPEAREPMLQCEAMPEEGDLDSEYFQEAMRRTGARSGEELLVMDGWTHPDKFTYEKVVHVDELEKIEGPPPEGPF